MGPASHHQTDDGGIRYGPDLSDDGILIPREGQIRPVDPLSSSGTGAARPPYGAIVGKLVVIITPTGAPNHLHNQGCTTQLGGGSLAERIRFKQDLTSSGQDAGQGFPDTPDLPSPLGRCIVTQEAGIVLGKGTGDHQRTRTT